MGERSDALTPVEREEAELLEGELHSPREIAEAPFTDLIAPTQTVQFAALEGVITTVEPVLLQETDDPTLIRVQIEQTRAGMTETIDAIKNKLDPHRIVADVKDSVFETTVHTAHQVVNVVRVGVLETTDKAHEAGTVLISHLREHPTPLTVGFVFAVGLLYIRARLQTR